MKSVHSATSQLSQHHQHLLEPLHSLPTHSDNRENLHVVTAVHITHDSTHTDNMHKWNVPSAFHILDLHKVLDWAFSFSHTLTYFWHSSSRTTCQKCNRTSLFLLFWDHHKTSVHLPQIHSKPTYLYYITTSYHVHITMTQHRSIQDSKVWLYK